MAQPTHASMGCSVFSCYACGVLVLLSTRTMCAAKASENAKAKAVAAAKAQKRTGKRKAIKVRTSVTFHRPKTLKTPRNPKYPKISAPPMQRLDHFRVRPTALPGALAPPQPPYAL